MGSCRDTELHSWLSTRLTGRLRTLFALGEVQVSAVQTTGFFAGSSTRLALNKRQGHRPSQHFLFFFFFFQIEPICWNLKCSGGYQILIWGNFVMVWGVCVQLRVASEGVELSPVIWMEHSARLGLEHGGEWLMWHLADPSRRQSTRSM